MTDKIRVCVIGHGHLGRWHAQKADLLEESTLSVIAEHHPEIRAELTTKYPNTKLIYDFHEALDDFDAAIISSPTKTHFSLAKDLINAGKHVFCEKPMTLTYEEALELGRVLEGTQTIFQVGHSERCHEIWENESFLKPILEKTEKVIIERLAIHKPRIADADVMQDLMIHDVDLLYYLFKQDPSEIVSTAQKTVTKRWDIAEANFSFASGLSATIKASRDHESEVRQVIFQWDGGECLVDMMTNNVRLTENDIEVENFSYNKRDHLLIEQAAFYKSINNNSDPLVSYEDGLRAMKWIDQIESGAN